MDDAQKQLEQVRAAKPRVFAAFSRFGKISGVGITKSGERYGLKVNFSALDAPRDSIPREWEGVSVDHDVTGPIVKR